MSNSKFNRIYIFWKEEIQRVERARLENELENLKKNVNDVCSQFISCIPSCIGFYDEIVIINSEQYERLYNFLNCLKNEDNLAYCKFTEGHDIVNLDKYLSFEGKEIYEMLNKFYYFKEYLYFLSHLILKIYDEKNEEKKKEMLQAMM